MPLFIDDIQIEDNFECSPENIFKRFQNLRTRSKNFLDNGLSKKRTLHGSDGSGVDGDKGPLLFVGEREYGVISTALNAGQCFIIYILIVKF